MNKTSTKTNLDQNHTQTSFKDHLSAIISTAFSIFAIVVIVGVLLSQNSTKAEQLDNLSDFNLLQSGTQPADFSDVPSSSTFYQFIQNLRGAGIISGFSDNTFRPNNPVTRGEMAKFVVKSLGLETSTNTNCGPFADVPATSTFFAEITILKCSGIVSGFGGNTFLPNNPVSRGEVAKFVDLGLKGSLYKTLDNKNEMLQASLVNLANKNNLDILDSSLVEPNLPIFDNCKEYYGFISGAQQIANSTFCSNIHNLVYIKLFNPNQITPISTNGSATAGDNFKPLDNITRGEMSKVVWRAKQLVDWQKNQSKGLSVISQVRLPKNNCSSSNFASQLYANTAENLFAVAEREPLTFDAGDVAGVNAHRQAFDEFITEIENYSISQVPKVFAPNCTKPNREKLYRQVLPITWIGTTRSSLFIEAERAPNNKVQVVVRGYARKPGFVYYTEFNLQTAMDPATRAAKVSAYNLCVNRNIENAGAGANPTLIKSDCVLQEYIVAMGGVNEIEKKAQTWLESVVIG